MPFFSLRTLAIGVLAVLSGLTTAETDEKATRIPCTIRSPNTGVFYDLRSLSIPLPDPDKKPKSGARTESWSVRGWNYNANFTMNICTPVIEEVKEVDGIKEAQWRNVSAFYKKSGKTFSIGQESPDVTLVGHKLVLQYINGSPCGRSDKKKLGSRREAETSLASSKESKEETDEDEKYEKDSEGHGRKSTLITFHCEREPMTTAASITFAGTDPDECAYFFEVRSAAACGGAEPVQQTLGPGGVFGVIALIAVVVYFIGGIMYQRSVAHARGWRQLPNYSLWAGIGSFFQDMFIIATSSCARFLPSRRGYISVSANGNSRGRSGRSEDENRLIDQLDEEWDD